MKKSFAKGVASSLLVLSSSLVMGAPITLDLPRPDGQPGNPKKPVKVYILAGQSNMVGMGDVMGAQLPHNLFFAADPALLPGSYQLDRHDDLKPLTSVTFDWHGVYGAQATVYAGSADSAKPVGAPAPVALGSVLKSLPVTQADQTVVVTAQIDVPVTGVFQIHAGFGDSSQCVALLDGKEVYRKDAGGKPVLTKVALEQGKRYPVRVTYFKSGSAAFWLEQVDLLGRGDLVGVTKNDKKFPYLVDDQGNWTVRNDVYFQEARLTPGGRGCPLSATSNAGGKIGTIGPELGFGYVMGTLHDEQVLLIKTAQGNRSLDWDFRPPSSGRRDLPGSEEYEGYEYRAMVKGVHETLAMIDKVVPGYQGQGYEMAGFFWFQGHKDSGSTKEGYETNLVNLIQDLRKEFKAPKMPAVVATVGFGGYGVTAGSWKGVWEAQMAVGDPKQHPELAGTVASVDTRDFWREVEESPRGQDYHYNRNAETYLLVGEAAGRAMVRLQGGEAETFPKSDREARFLANAAKPEPTQEQVAAHTAAIRPMLLEGALESFLRSSKNLADLRDILAGKKPAKSQAALDDTLDLVVYYYQAAKVSDYDWKPVVDTSVSWDYLAFDLPGSDRKTRPNLFSRAKAEQGEEDQDAEPSAAPAVKGKKAPAALPPPIIVPAGLENWFKPEFDAHKAGWKTGVAPFGESTEGLILPDYMKLWQKKRNKERPQPATVTDGDVLLLRQAFDVPAFKEGYRYRVRIAGSAHNNMGEGYGIYINGKLLAEDRDGLLGWHRQVFTTRGAHIPKEFWSEFTGGKVTLGVGNYPLWGAGLKKLIAPGPALSVWLESQKIPPLPELPPEPVVLPPKKKTK
jgi:alpha-galactosidase